MKQANTPFQFVTASYLIRICPDRAGTIEELSRNLKTCSDASIFHHTFQSLERQHYAAFSNDFAQWVEASCGEPSLAERLAAIDVRDCTSLAILRDALVNIADSYVRANASSAGRAAFEPFYFSEALEFTVPREETASTLEELEEGIRRISLQTLHHHFINSRLRLHLQTNDFSYWIENSLRLPELSRRIDRIDIYVNTLEKMREEIMATIHSRIDQ
ncbi:MAG: DUF5752 family protein [Candidatus Acidiferrales bacterium]